METAAASAEIGPGSAGVIASRGRGGNTGAPIRGSYERGRGRGISRGHYQNSMNSMGYMGRGGFNSRGGIAGSAPGHQSRGGFAPRGMPMRGGTGLSVSVNFQSRGGFIPRGSAGIRGTGRMPMYTQTTKQHSGVDNNKTVSPMPNATATTNVTSADGTIPESGESSVNAEANANISVGPVIPSNANNTSTGTYTNFRGGRGRGGSISRGGMGRGGVHHLQHNSNLSTMHVTNTMQEHGQIRRGAPSRGRGGYMGSAPMTRPPMHQQHVANTQIASVPSLKRGAPTGPPGPKRGRYEGSPYSQRGAAPKYHQPHHHMQTMQQQATYGVSHQATTHMQRYIEFSFGLVINKDLAIKHTFHMINRKQWIHTHTHMLFRIHKLRITVTDKVLVTCHIQLRLLFLKPITVTFQLQTSMITRNIKATVHLMVVSRIPVINLTGRIIHNNMELRPLIIIHHKPIMLITPSKHMTNVPMAVMILNRISKTMQTQRDITKNILTNAMIM
uniref:Uncharacterized protein n=1 Tax=Glossina morsitans morsitans TaxID=37546 RepID=A0A1B0GF20_GLOMM